LKKEKSMYEIELNGTPVKIWARSVDPHAYKEIYNLSTLPFVYHHLAFMPDVHGGMGMPIGGVLATRGVVVPNAVGVDIGCGMCAVKTSLKVADIPETTLRKGIMSGIRRRIPLGMEHHRERQDNSLMPRGHDIEALHVVSHQYVSATKQIGTLGGGNHFIELQKDGEGTLWVMLHSGSRNLGKQVGDYYNKVAKNLNSLWYSNVDPDIQMHFLPLRTQEFKDYWAEMTYCIDFAFCNRKLMMDRILEVIKDCCPEAEFEPMINIAHNYAAWENHFGQNVIVHRKGAVRAREGEVGIIPGSQGTRSYIVEGLGNADSFMSSSHGAGRLMSRSEAVRTLDFDAEVSRLESRGIIHALRGRSDLEEAAGAYKDIGEVLANESDLVRVVTELSPVAVIKGL
jgi:tRNA-splicing ligase RtcB (3'-phosphate/5'-hydroxy nucleic acid ligase)